MAWIVAAEVHGEECAFTAPRTRDIKGRDGSKIGEAAWVTKKSASSRDSKDWWKKYAWAFETKYEATCALEILHEKIAAGECSEFNRPQKTWVEEL